MKAAAYLLLSAGMLAAQVPNPTNQQSAPANNGQPMPIFKVTVVSRTVKAVNYHHRTGTTHIDFRGTELMPAARGDASVQSQMGSTKIDTQLTHMTAANQFGPEYMTYVLWAITPEGRANNLGEVVLQGDHAHLLSTTDLQAFGLIVTAEPYFAVTQPSDVVVAENFLRSDTSGTIEQVDAKYELLERGQYVMDRGQYKPVRINPKGPLQLAEAENAVEIARLAGAPKYAADTFQKAQVDLQNAEQFLKNNRKESETNAREAAQMSEDARIITIRKQREEELANERAAAAAREAAAQQRAQQAQAQAKAEEAARMQAERMKSEAQLAAQQAQQAQQEAQQQAQQARLLAQQAAQEKAEADAARQQAMAQQAAAMAEADRLKQVAAQSEAEKTQLRERLKEQFNAILQTTESARGLIVNINDVLFDFNKYTLKPGAREKLAKVSGILLAYPGLKVRLEGHTDSIGTDEYNMDLSEKRAQAVSDYLVSQGVPEASLSAVGMGKSRPGGNERYRRRPPTEPACGHDRIRRADRHWERSTIISTDSECGAKA